MNARGRFERQVLPHLAAAYNLARWLTRNEHDAEDVVQEAFMRAMRYFANLKGAEARPWLLAIVRNTCYTWLEKNRPAELVAMDEGGVEAAAEAHGTASGCDGKRDVARLRGANRLLVILALDELPVACREVVVMREIEDLSYKE